MNTTNYIIARLAERTGIKIEWMALLLYGSIIAVSVTVLTMGKRHGVF